MCYIFLAKIMIKITRGFQFKKEVPNEFCVLVLKSDNDKIMITDIRRQDGKLYLICNAETTATFNPGIYKFQLIDNLGILESGDSEVIQNYLLSEQGQVVKTRNQILLEAIEAQLAGVATSAQSSISVGDKSISYMSINELLKLRQYYKNKVDQEQGKRNADNEGRILYRWRGL